MAPETRKTGIDVVGDMPWGTHFCLFYETKEDLLETLISYCKTGLESEEFCLWVVAEPLTIEEAMDALKHAVPDLDRYLADPSIEIVSARDWYLQGGTFDLNRVTGRWHEKLARASAKGYAGVRVTGDTAWLEKKDWKDFCEYEEGLNEAVANQHLAVLCTYPLAACGAVEILDVVRTHQFALAKRHGSWDEIHPMAEEDFRDALHKLADAELLYVRGIAPDATYQFKHALIQDAAYEALLKTRRKELHRTIASNIDQKFLTLKETHPEVLARHWTEAGEIEPAIAEWSRAGRTAQARNAFKEALESYQQALALLRTLPDTAGRVDQELTLQTALGLALVMTKGLGATEVREAYDHARKLCDRVGDTPEIFAVLIGLCNFYIQQADAPTAQKLAEQILKLAEKLHDPQRRIAAHRVLVSTSFWRGAFTEANEHCERVIALYGPERDRSLALVYGLDPCVVSLSIGAWALWYLGYPDQALKRCEAALVLAREIDHRYTLAGALDMISWTYAYRREGEKGLELADEGIALSTAQEFPHWRAMGLIMRGLARTELGEPGGAQDIREGVDAYRATGAILGGAANIADLAKAFGCQGKSIEGLGLLDEALSAAKDTGLRHYEAEINRLRGELLLGGANETIQAEQCFRTAIAVSRNQSAKSLELRATMSLARLLAKQDRRDEARPMLADIYGWFTEGFDTADLIDAKALLDELHEDR